MGVVDGNCAGFDVAAAKALAAELGIRADQITATSDCLPEVGGGGSLGAGRRRQRRRLEESFDVTFEITFDVYGSPSNNDISQLLTIIRNEAPTADYGAASPSPR